MALRVAQKLMLLDLYSGRPFNDGVPSGYNLGWLAQTTRSLEKRGLIARDLNSYVLTSLGFRTLLKLTKKDRFLYRSVHHHWIVSNGGMV